MLASRLSIGSIAMIALPEFESNHSLGRSCIIMGSADDQGFIPIIPFSRQEDLLHPGLNLYPGGIGGRNDDGYLMIAHQGYCHISRIYRSLGYFSKGWMNRIYEDLESSPHRIIARIYRELI